ncbi:Os05g0350900 [Oryza sativa Japonica Group]|jgi:hypothetical protein|uniref:Os05g0350900 protein n=4 Tax=Oryza TaxID=4527 RepID=Q5W6G6_ORYSJ|nr:unknown protein [Oryza sativa Japonica Group]KAF2930335.1 hypothetical protein DAI22_05g127100 [Oryza sativa Japonica Group]BAF17191.1 Os05g0350900 [Oryza sativa Japonica Group]|eukprot:NP_001055277.1 Os05g0350900 [Oryza sativa Japonica Group]
MLIHGEGSSSSAAAAGGKIKGSWSPEEDEQLRGAVARHGPRNWTAISEEVPGRSGKSCRLRWCNQLSPGVHRRPFTPDEDALIVAAHAKYGNKWATIARLLDGRTDNSVKNHWNSSLRRNRRAAAAAAAAAASVSYQSMDLTEEADNDDEGTSDDSVAIPAQSSPAAVVAGVPVLPPPPPPAKRLCVAPPTGVEHRAPPPDPPTSLSLSPPGAAAAAISASTVVGGSSAARAEEEAVAREKARMEQDPWLMAMMRQMITEEVQRQVSVVYSLVASSAAMAAQTGNAGGVGRKGPDGRPSNGQD